MGNYLSGERKPLHKEELLQKENSREVVWIDGQIGYQRGSEIPGAKKSRSHWTQRNFSFNGRNGRCRNVRLKTTQSLDAIIEELYLSGTEDNVQEVETEINVNKSFIPRIKLTRSVSSLKEERHYKSPFEMSTNPEIFCVPDKEENVHHNLISDEINSSSKFDNLYTKSEENYFTKNFDECVKRLQLIEKEHEMLEEKERCAEYPLQKQAERKQVETSEEDKILPPEIQLFVMSSKISNSHSDKENKKEKNESEQGESTERMKRENLNLKENEKGTLDDSKREQKDAKENHEAISEWYSYLKQTFENMSEENEENKSKEVSCRIMGATLKNANEIRKSEDKEKETRLYFSRLVKSNKSLIDEELPDPDKVKNIRAMFQENLNLALNKNLDKKLGGSLQNINSRSCEQPLTRPLSAQCNRNDESEKKCNKSFATEMYDLVKDSEKESQTEITKKKLFEKYEKDLKMGRDFKNRKFLQAKWTDTGSVSSGISSDLSSYDTDVESFSRELTEQEPDEITVSDDDLQEDLKDRNYVQNEILEKIRSFGTSVTYYGGEMITCSVGPLLSPTTQAIMEEISEKFGREANATRSFDEFYRKYVETNDTIKKKKVGRTRSFGQNDVFYKPNVLNNTEIDMYKDDLETEIGIRMPTGVSQNGLKMKLTKSKSLETEKKSPEVEKPGVRSVSRTVTEKESIQPIIEIKITSEDEAGNEITESTIETAINTEGELGAIKSHSETETEYSSVHETEEEEKEHAVTVNKGEIKSAPFLLRSKSTPEELVTGSEFKNEIPLEVNEQSKEILFGYEKSLVNIRRKSDMEFEEFEVCETILEKLDRLKEKNKSNSQSYSETESKSGETQSIEARGEHPSEAPELLNEKNEGPPRRKWNIDLNEVLVSDKMEQHNEKSTKIYTFESMEKIESNQREHEKQIFGLNNNNISSSNNNNDDQSVTILGNENNNNQTSKKYEKYIHSRWPIETSVMVDIQKNNEKTPKIVTNGKSIAKAKIRLF